jgi:hypothetical protein
LNTQPSNSTQSHTDVAFEVITEINTEMNRSSKRSMSFAESTSYSSDDSFRNQRTKNYVQEFFVQWFGYFSANKEKILLLVFVNALLTFAIEAVLRGYLLSNLFNNQDNQLLVQGGSGLLLNKQTFINITMTMIATLLGGPVYFYKSRKARLLYFMIFGVINSCFAQSISHYIFQYSLNDFTKRLGFDFIYSLCIRFSMFEFFRKEVLRAQTSLFKILFARSKQDVLTALVRVIVLNLFHMSHL